VFVNSSKCRLAFAIFVVALVALSSCLAFGAAPVAVDDAVTMDEDTFVLIDVLANDTGLTTIASVATPHHGATIIEGDKVRYTPDEDYCGTDSFSYTATDGIDTATATVTVTVTSINDAPVAVDDVVTTLQDTPVSFTLRATDVDVDPTAPLTQPLVFKIISAPAHGVLSGDLTDVKYEFPHTVYVTVTYTPVDGYVTVTTDGEANKAGETHTFIVTAYAQGVAPDSWTFAPTVSPSPDSQNVTGPTVAADGMSATWKLTISSSSAEAFTVSAGVDLDFGTTTITRVTDGMGQSSMKKGFTGRDSFTFSVTDPFDLYDTAVVEIVVGERELGTLAGTWDTSITMEGQPFGISALKSSLTGIYRLGEFEARVKPVWYIDSFSSLTINAELPLGELVTVRSTLAFDPDDSPYFSYWRTLTRFSFSDINLSHTFYLPEDSDSSYHQIAARARIGDVSASSTTKFTSCEAAFDEQVFTGRWRWTECDLSLYARLSIECDGFDEFSLTVRDIPIVYSEDEEFGITLRLETTFTTTDKTIEPTFTWRSNWIDCFKIRCEVLTAEDNDMSIEGISIYGVQFKTTFDGITLRMDTSLVEDKNSTMTGYSDYFEKWLLSGSVPACCGSSGRWQATTYFQSSESELFGWGMSTFKLEAPLAEQFLVSTEFSFQSDEPHWEWTIGWKLHW